jgi:hypothetical protein
LVQSVAVRRSLFNQLTLLSSLLLCIAVALWLRSGGSNDELILRTAGSYAGWPNVKRVVVRPYDGWVVSFHHAFVPRVDAGPPPWRSDVPLALKRLQPPTNRNTVPLSDAERREFEAAASEAYRSERWFRWRTGPRGPRPPGPAPMLVMSTWLTEAGVEYYADTFLIDDPQFPGAFREVRVGIPHGLVVAAASCLPAIWIVLWARRFSAELSRRRSGRCPGCGYDLRASHGRCPECGRAFDAAAQFARGQSAEPSPTARPVRRRRWETAVFAAVLVGVALAVAWGWDTTPVPVRPRAPVPTWQDEAGTFHAESVTAEYGPVRFEAVWHKPRSFSPPLTAVAVFDLAGPLVDTARNVDANVSQVAIDPTAKSVYGSSGYGPPCVVGRWGTTPITVGRGPDHCTGVAFDTRRRRLMIASGFGFGVGFGSSILTYDVESGAWSAGAEIGRGSDVVALAYSAEHDCVYAVLTPTRVDPPTLVRLTPQGDAEWRIPLPEPISEAGPGVRHESFQLVAAGPLLALIRSDDSPARWPAAGQQLTLIDPTAGRAVYRGALTPHRRAGPGGGE